ncbi:MAG: fused MFS/spermidine synthase [Solirubrobacteraceae bacterium]
MCSLGGEIAAARLMAPFFGSSTIVWANTIAVVLLALSVGYYFGGRLADRHPHKRGLCAVVLCAAGLLALVPLVARPFLNVSVEAFESISVGAAAGSLFGVLVLVAAPVLLLGTVAPWVLRLSIADVKSAGETAGRLYALSTVGSLFGTFLSALVLIPLVGPQRTFLLYAVALAGVAALALGRRFTLVPLAIAALVAVPIGTTKAADDGGDRVVDERETSYQYARVVEDPDGTRTLELNEGQAIHSMYKPGTVLTDNYWDAFLAVPATALGRAPRSLAVLGDGAGTMTRAYGEYFPQTTVDAVEIDGELTELGRRWFGLSDRPGLRFITEDARPFLRRTDRRYEAIFVDAYRQPYIPFYLSTREFFALVADRLAPGGVVVVNVGHPEGSDDLEQTLTATMRTAFASVMRDPVKDVNTLLVASQAPVTAAKASAADLPADVEPIAADVAGRLRPALPGGDVYTDDRAPVEWLIDKSIVSYAAGD